MWLILNNKMNKTQQKFINLRKRMNIQPFPSYWNVISESGKLTKKLHGVNFKSVYLLYRDGYYLLSHRADEFEKLSIFVSNRLLKNNLYLKNIYKLHINECKNSLKYIKKLKNYNLSKLALNDLLSQIKNLQKHWVKLDEINVLPWFVGGDGYQKLVFDKLALYYNLSQEEFDKLVLSPEKSFSADEELEIYRLALKIKNNEYTINSKQCLETINELINKYYWILFGYDGPLIYNQKHYISTIDEVLKNNKEFIIKHVRDLENYTIAARKNHKLIIKKHKINQDDYNLIRQIHILSFLTDDRKRIHFQLNIQLDRILFEVAKKIGLDKNCLKFLHFDEIVRYKNNKNKIIKLNSERRRNSVIFCHFNCKFRIIEKNNAKKLAKIIAPEIYESNVFTGVVASKGNKEKILGKVKKILSPKNNDKIVNGEILVAEMTTPEYVPAMRKASAIITDEGGVTCHAAIVSRELGIPCIIGTKIATKVLKNGDYVLVDANKGIITKLKDAK